MIDRLACGTAVPAPPDIARGRVHVWFATLDHADEVVLQLAESLSTDERERAGRFQFERDRRRFIVGRAVLRAILGACLEVEPRFLSFRYGRFGKPALADAFEGTEVRFNVSHSHGVALYAVARGREVGVDLERIRPLDDMESLAEECFSAKQNAALRSMSAPKRLEAFFSGWTRKEAFVKARGVGLSFSLAGFDVSLEPGDGPRPLTIPGDSQEESRWMVTSLAADPAYAAALVVEGRDWDLCTRGWAA